VTYVYIPIGWQDWENERHEVTADRDIPGYTGTADSGDPSQVQAILVWAYDPDDESAPQKHTWIPVGGPFETWAEWDLLIEAILDMYGLEM
jgi:hypothetical protein